MTNEMLFLDRDIEMVQYPPEIKKVVRVSKTNLVLPSTTELNNDSAAITSGLGEQIFVQLTALADLLVSPMIHV